MHIFSISGRLYHINSEINMHIFSILGRLYHINSETDMHIFSIFGRMYHINSQNIVYAFAPSRVLFLIFVSWRKDCLRVITGLSNKGSSESLDRLKNSTRRGRTVPGGEG